MAKADSQRLTKQQRREAAREEARRLREEQERRDKRNRMLMIAGVIGIIVLAIAATAAIIVNSNRSPLDGAEGPQGAVEGGIPINAELVAGQEGAGEVVVDVYLDYACSWCAVFEDRYADAIHELAAGGEANFWFHPVAILDPTGDFTGFSGLAANAAGTVAHLSPEYFVPFHEQLFVAYAANPASGLSEIEQAAAVAGVPQDVIDRFGAGEFRDWTEGSTRLFLTDVAQGTPHILVDGEVIDWNQENGLQDAIAAAAAEG
ncbi:MAG TPA: thioredoxin domain-containing protein [Actinomycetaceae bacterium]|nr:thioredoxin domain-containing protein [Actinomycetaceae bacterium]